MPSCLSHWCNNAWNKVRNICRQLKERQQQGKYLNAVNRSGLLDLEKKTMNKNEKEKRGTRNGIS